MCMVLCVAVCCKVLQHLLHIDPRHTVQVGGVRTHTCTHARTHAHTHANAHAHAQMHTRASTHTQHIHTYTHMHTHTHMHARTHACTHSRNHTERGEGVVRLLLKVEYLCTRVTSKNLRTFLVVVRHAHMYTHVELLRVSARQPPGRVTHCNTLQQTATHCNTLRHTPDSWVVASCWCHTLQYTKTNCYTLLYTAASYTAAPSRAIHCNTLQHTATHCNTLQHTACFCLVASCSCHTLQRTAKHCNTLLIPAWLLLAPRTATKCNILQHMVYSCLAVSWSRDTLQQTAPHCNTLRIPGWRLPARVAHCNTLHHTATHSLFLRGSLLVSSAEGFDLAHNSSEDVNGAVCGGCHDGELSVLIVVGLRCCVCVCLRV